MTRLLTRLLVGTTYLFLSATTLLLAFGVWASPLHALHIPSVANLTVGSRFVPGLGILAGHTAYAVIWFAVVYVLIRFGLGRLDDEWRRNATLTAATCGVVVLVAAVAGAASYVLG